METTACDYLPSWWSCTRGPVPQAIISTASSSLPLSSRIYRPAGVTATLDPSVSRILATASSNFSKSASLASPFEEEQEQLEDEFADRTENGMEEEQGEGGEIEEGREGAVWPSSKWLTVDRWWAPNPDALSDEIRLFVER